MKLLTQVFTNVAVTDEEAGFSTPQYGLITLNSPAVYAKLLKLRDLVDAVSVPKPIFGPRCFGSRNFSFDHMVIELKACFAVFFNDYSHQAVGPYLKNTLIEADDGEETLPFAGGLDYCLVPDALVVPEPDEDGGCATIGDNGPVHRYISFYLMVATEGFWFTNSVKGFSVKLMTAVIPWNTLDKNNKEVNL